MHDELNDLQRDALAETFNIGIGRASRALSQLTGSEVALSVPIILQMEPADVGAVLAPKMYSSPDVCAVTRSLQGIEAEVVMIFQGSGDAMTLVQPEWLERDGKDESQNPREGLATKIAYLVTESCLDQVENVVGRNVERMPLQYLERVPAHVFGRELTGDSVILVKIDLAFAKRGLTAHLLFSIPRKSANRLADGLDRLVQQSE